MMRERKRKRGKEIGKERMREKRQLASFQSVIDILLSNCLFCCSTVFLNNFFCLLAPLNSCCDWKKEKIEKTIRCLSLVINGQPLTTAPYEKPEEEQIQYIPRSQIQQLNACGRLSNHIYIKILTTKNAESKSSSLNC